MLMTLLCLFLLVLLPATVVVVIMKLSGSCAHSGVVISGRLKTNFNFLKGTHRKLGLTWRKRSGMDLLLSFECLFLKQNKNRQKFRSGMESHQRRSAVNGIAASS